MSVRKGYTGAGVVGDWMELMTVEKGAGDEKGA